MDFLDTSKLLRTERLDQVLECLDCCEDSNAKDSIFSKSTTLEYDELEFDASLFFGESFKKAKDSEDLFDFASDGFNCYCEQQDNGFLRKPLNDDCFQFFDKRWKV